MVYYIILVSITLCCVFVFNPSVRWIKKKKPNTECSIHPHTFSYSRCLLEYIFHYLQSKRTRVHTHTLVPARTSKKKMILRRGDVALFEWRVLTHLFTSLNSKMSAGICVCTTLVCVCSRACLFQNTAAFFCHYSLFSSATVAAVPLQACFLNKLFIRIPSLIFLKAAEWAQRLKQPQRDGCPCGRCLEFCLLFFNIASGVLMSGICTSLSWKICLSGSCWSTEINHPIIVHMHFFFRWSTWLYFILSDSYQLLEILRTRQVRWSRLLNVCG